MKPFTIHSIDDAPDRSKPILIKARKALGLAPNLMRVMAESPPTLEAYMTLIRLFDKSSFDATQRQVILLAVSKENGCGYCLSAHSRLATLNGVSQEVISAVRAGSPVSDERLQLLVDLVRSIVSTRGWPDQALVERFYALGYTRQQYLEVLLGVTMKTLSNYVNHAADIPTDEAFAA